jgi:glycosyltransferase involved in cell wall biosynthesis
MGLKDGENVLIADNAEDFADKVVALYDDQSAWDNLSQNSLKYVKENNSAEVAENKFNQLFKDLLRPADLRKIHSASK